MPNTIHGEPLPTFPAVWYHPIFGAREVKSMEDFLQLDNNWRATAAEADKDRTETEAAVVMNHNAQVKREAYLREAEKLGPAPKVANPNLPLPEGHDEKDDGIVRNSVQQDEAVKQGAAQPR